MATFLYKTKNGGPPQKNKPRIYFTCHPDDRERYFETLQADLFEICNCVIYYTDSLTDGIAQENLDTDLGSMHLFIVPVTYRLLTQPNRAMDFDLAYAKAHNIMVLPFMMEPGLTELYSRPEKFGNRQFLSPGSADSTEIAYKDKLRKCLASVLLSDSMHDRIRAAFDGRIFLSYRKKDRHYANALMRLIHSRPECRDIAIWYDEFLTPGENFTEEIQQAMENSKLVALLVTPNLLEESNFVMRVEYPAALKSNKTILPAEMEATQADALSEKFPGIPERVDPHQEGFHSQLMKAIGKMNNAANDRDPEHNFLIGLAYRDGIDVEIDRQRAMDLIFSAAASKWPEAMEEAYTMCANGFYIQRNYREAVFWAEQLVEYYVGRYGLEHPDTCKWMHTLAMAYEDNGEYRKAADMNEKLYAVSCRVFGKEHPDTLGAMNNLAYTYYELGYVRRALELHEEVYAVSCCVLGEEHPDTLISLGNMALAFAQLGDQHRALELLEKVYTIRCRILGEKHFDTIGALYNLASTYSSLNDHGKALELQEKAYGLCCRVLGEDHPNTMMSQYALAMEYDKTGELGKALKLMGKVCVFRAHLYGEGHQMTVGAQQFLQYLRQKQKQLQEQWKKQGVCTHCGGTFRGIFRKKCSQCGKEKNY